MKRLRTPKCKKRRKKKKEGAQDVRLQLILPAVRYVCEQMETHFSRLQDTFQGTGNYWYIVPGLLLLFF